MKRKIFTIFLIGLPVVVFALEVPYLGGRVNDLASMIDNREMLECDPAKMYCLRNMLEHICSTLDNEPDRLKQDIELQNLVNFQVPYLLAEALMTSTVHRVKATASNRSRTIKTAID